MKKTLVLLVLLLLPSKAPAADPLMHQPRWSLELKGGAFAPALENWSRYYGKRDMPEYAISLAYKFLRQVELGASAGSITAKGQAIAPLHGVSAGNVTYELYPVNVFVLVRGVFDEEQWLVPYAGGGWTSLNYRQEAEGGQTVRGSVDGYHFRGGLQFSLDNLDASASSSMYADYGVIHTYFFIEAEHTRAVLRFVSIDLGGTAYRGGLLFEF